MSLVGWRDYVLSKKKPYFLVRMLPFEQSYAVAGTEVALSLAIMQKLWLPMSDCCRARATMGPAAWRWLCSSTRTRGA